MSFLNDPQKAINDAQVKAQATLANPAKKWTPTSTSATDDDDKGLKKPNTTNPHDSLQSGVWQMQSMGMSASGMSSITSDKSKEDSPEDAKARALQMAEANTNRQRAMMQNLEDQSKQATEMLKKITDASDKSNSDILRHM